MTEPVKSLPSPPPASNDLDPVADAESTAPAADQPERLVIEASHNGATYAYKLYDRATGALLIELPRKEAAKMGQSQNYGAGQVLDTKA